MWVSKITEEDLTNEIIDRLLFEGIEDTGEHTDCIIVLGSTKAAKYRVPIAVDAYNAGRANKILLCGGALKDFPEGRDRVKGEALNIVKYVKNGVIPDFKI